MQDHRDDPSHTGGHPSHGGGAAAAGPSLNRLAASATIHCLIGCGTGEVLGIVIGSAMGWSTAATIALAVVLAFLFGYAMTMIPLLRAGLGLRRSIRIGLAADTVSITIMEIVDNLVILAIPGAMAAPLTSLLFWGAMALALVAAGFAAFPVNRWLIARGRGHAVAHAEHGH